MSQSGGAKSERIGACVELPIEWLLPGDSPRSDGADADHVTRLAEVGLPLPPILVDRTTLRVIDGTHRLLAAARRGDRTIGAEFFDGTPEEAFLRAVEANVSHGLPLGRQDRHAAAQRIVASHPTMSDREIARAAGLSTRTVATIRLRTGGAASSTPVRIGRDGKNHPTSTIEGRVRAAELIAEFPGASLREIARRAGISPATVSDVRKRLASGEQPVLDERPLPLDEPAPAPPSSPAGAGKDEPTSTLSYIPCAADPEDLLEALLRDPSMRMRQDGRQILRMLQQMAREQTELSRLARAVPPHCAGTVADLVHHHTRTWTEFAQALDARSRHLRSSRIADGTA